MQEIFFEESVAVMYELPRTLKRMLSYHYDRRLRVYDFLTTLDTAHLDMDMKVGHVSIRLTLLHCLECELHWMQKVVQGAPFAGLDETQYLDLASIRQLASDVRAGTERFLAGATKADWEATYSKTWNDIKFEFDLEGILLHVITHDAHHRGQVLALSRQLGYTPPDIDFL